MGNKATGGPFAPLVVVVRNIVGEKEFNKLRGKAISLHSQGALFAQPRGGLRGLRFAFDSSPVFQSFLSPGQTQLLKPTQPLTSPRPQQSLTHKHPTTVIKDFCKQVGVDNKQVQGVVRLAKKNGEWLGFLA
jgi:hypothetical protein